MGERYLDGNFLYEAVKVVWRRTGKNSSEKNKFFKESEQVKFLHDGTSFMCQTGNVMGVHEYLRKVYDTYGKVMEDLGTSKDISPRITLLLVDYIKKNPKDLELVLDALINVDKNSRIRDNVVAELKGDPFYRLALIASGRGELAGRLKEISAVPTRQRLALPSPEGHVQPIDYPGSNWDNQKCFNYAYTLTTSPNSVANIIKLGIKKDKVSESLGMLYKAVNLLFDTERSNQFKGVNKMLSQFSINKNLNSNEKAARLYVSLIKEHIEENAMDFEAIESGLKILGNYHPILHECYKSISIEESLRAQEEQKAKDKEIGDKFKEKMDKASARKARKLGGEISGLESLIGLTDEEVETKIGNAVHPFDRLQIMVESKYLNPEKISQFDFYVADIINLILAGKKDATKDERSKGYRKWAKSTYQVTLEDHPDYDAVLNSVFTAINELNNLLENKTLIREKGSEGIKKLMETAQTLIYERSANIVIKEGDPFICIVTSVESMLERMRIKDSPSVRVNGKNISKEEWADFMIKPGDNVEIIRMKSNKA